MTGKKRKKLIRVPYIDQTEKWPTGCESVSTVMLLQYLGIDISVKQFVEQYLEKEPFMERDGKLYGGNPWEVFAGDPADHHSMGCYAPVIKKALDKIFAQGLLSGENLETVDLTGVSTEILLRDYIDNDMPVIFWASIDLKETYSGPEWILKDSGERFLWRSNEHCMLLVGYDEEYYYFNDPWHDHGTIGYEKKLAEKRHAEQYRMAVSMKRRKGND